MKRIKQFLIFSIIAMITVSVVTFAVNRNQGKTDSLSGIPTPSSADLSIDKIHYTQTNAEKKAWELIADSAQYFKKKSYTELIKVKATFYDQGGGTITLTGERGTISNDNKDIKITGNVVATSSRGYILRTNSLNYLADQKKIITSDHVEITGEKMRVEGDGLTMDLLKEKLAILKNVKSSFLDMKLF